MRTVETHVSSLLRKLGVPDRRALADLAVELARAERSSQALAGLPSPLSPFVGRARERAALREAVGAHRQVTAVGPGGVGKTRLALAVAADLAGTFADGVWFVDLVPVTDPAMVGAAVAAALGLGEQQGRSIDDSVVAALADRRALLVLDNCEHLSDGRGTVRRAAAGALPGRERADHQPGPAHGAVRAGLPGAAAVPRRTRRSTPSPCSSTGPRPWAGPSSPSTWTRSPTSAGSSTAWRWRSSSPRPACPRSGSTGWSRALSDHLRLLVGGYRADDRHRSVRAMLDWSQALLDGADLALLRRVSVFVSPFTASAAAEVAGFGPLDPDRVVDGLARLADQSLLSVAASRRRHPLPGAGDHPPVRDRAARRDR